MATTDFFAIVKDLHYAVERATGRDGMRKIGEEAARLIRVRTRLGFGVSRQGGRRQRLKRLSPRYIQQRKESRGRLSSETKPRKSNLTRTGQMLDSMQVTRVSRRDAKVGPKGRRRGETLTNQKLVEYVAKQGRPFNTLTDNEIKKLRRFYMNGFQSVIKKRFARR